MEDIYTAPPGTMFPGTYAMPAYMLIGEVTDGDFDSAYAHGIAVPADIFG